MHAAPPTASLPERIAFPTSAARKDRAALRGARAEQRRFYQLQRAASDLRKMQERLAALAGNQSALRELTAQAEAAAPPIDGAAWPTDCQELADKIRREDYGGLAPSEAPVRDKDRQLIVKMLPAGIEVQKNDPGRC